MGKKYSDKFAKIIRVVSVPPVMTFAFIMVMWKFDNVYINSGKSALFLTLFLVVIPFLSYPVSVAVPAFKEKGREKQRNLAFAFSIIGYFLGLIFGIFCDRRFGPLLIYGVYFLSVILLYIFNKGLKVRASGHACSIAGPLLMLSFVFGLKGALICLVLFIIIFWASLKSRRHTAAEFLAGAFVNVLSLTTVWAILSMLRL